jgi:polygalacturonase
MRKYWLSLFLASSLSLLGACGGGGSSNSGGGNATHCSVSGPANIPSGTFFNFIVTALDASNKSVTSYSGTVHFTSTDPHAQLAPDSKLISGSDSFSATVTTAGNQMITATDTATATIAGSNSISVEALPGAFPVDTFGAKGDGHTDDTTAIQKAINAVQGPANARAFIDLPLPAT